MQGFGTEKVEEEIAGQFPCGEGGAAGFRYGPYPHGLRADHLGFREGEDTNLDWYPDVVEGIDFGNVSVVGIFERR